MLSEKDRKTLKEQREFDFSYSFEDKSRFRVNAFTQRGYLGRRLEAHIQQSQDGQGA